MAVKNFLKPYLPKSLLGRSVLIIVMPLVLLQVVTATIFFENHWNKVGRRLALGVSGDISYVIEAMSKYQDPAMNQWMFGQASSKMNLIFNMRADDVIHPPNVDNSRMVQMLTAALTSQIRKPFSIDSQSDDRNVTVEIQLGSDVLSVVVPNKRLFSTTTYVFVMWMVGTSLLLFGVATIFMKNQVRPISRLASAADAFGTGRDTPNFKPEGASEVRQAASAFIAMRDRIRRHIQQRTDMLAGVSHDLRTPITRMKLQLEMMGEGNGDDAAHLKSDIADMEHMLDEYLAFARGEGAEQPVLCNVSALLNDIATQARRKGAAIDLHTEGEIEATIRPNALKRALTNLIDNAVRYAENITVRAGLRDTGLEIVIDDDGPGIPEAQREEVFRPFYRLDGSRNPKTGGVGLGLTIALDAIRAHGGEITLLDAPGGGLRVKVSLPV